jgi:hypothetical protein
MLRESRTPNGERIGPAREAEILLVEAMLCLAAAGVSERDPGVRVIRRRRQATFRR